MDKTRVDEILRSYRYDVGRCGHLEAEIKMLENDLAKLRRTLADDVSIPKPQQLSGMPHGTMISNPTERIGMMLATGWEPDYIKDVEKSIQQLNEEYSEIYINVLFVQAWLKGLTEEESWIVEKQVVDGMYWRDVLTMYSIRFSKETSKDTLKRLRTRAMSKVYKMAE